jgi:hypothetical protein
MRLDIYRRSELNGNLSYLAVPEGQVIPDEATNTNWETAARAVDLEDGAEYLDEFSIEHPIQQISEKGYAITRLRYIS